MEIFKNLFKKSKSKHNKSSASSTIEETFEELSEVFSKKKRIGEYLVDIENREEEIEKFEALDKEDIEKLNVLANKAQDITEKKQNLRGRLIKNNKALFLISQYEDELPDLIKEIREEERRQKNTESNIFYLQDEKEELLEEREALLNGYHFLKIFSIFFVIIIAIAVMISLAVMQVLRNEIWIFLSLFGSALILFLAGILYSKDRIDRGLNNNVILQQKVAKYLNKSKIKYFNQTRYLDFQYEKLGVDSVAKLEMYYNRYIKNKDNEKIYLQLNHALSEIEDKMLDVIRNKKIHIDYIENLTDWVLAPRKVNAIKVLKTDKQKTHDQLQALNAYEEALWKEIFTMQEDEDVKELVQYKISEYNSRIERYLDKAGEDDKM